MGQFVSGGPQLGKVCFSLGRRLDHADLSNPKETVCMLLLATPTLSSGLPFVMLRCALLHSPPQEDIPKSIKMPDEA